MSIHIVSRGTAVNQVDSLGTVGDPFSVPHGVPGTSLLASASWATGGLTSMSAVTKTVTVTGAQVGDKVAVSASPAFPDGVNVSGQVTAANTVTLVAQNTESATVDPGTVTVTVTVLPGHQVGRNDGSL